MTFLDTFAPFLAEPIAGSEERLRPFTPKRLPKGWARVEHRDDGNWFRGPGGASVVQSVGIHADGKWWLHVSIARKTYMPTYGDLVWLKQTFIGDQLYAAMIFPPPDKHVNIHPHCLHLYACLEGWPLPEMSGVLLPGVRTI